MSIRKLMKKTVYTLKPDDTLYDAAFLMKKHNIGSVVIVDDNKRILGIITDRDLVLHFAKTKSMDSVVGQVMTSYVLTISEDAYPEDVSDLMGYAQVKRIPVLDNEGRLTGIVSLSDLARHKPSMHLSLEALSEISVNDQFN